MNDQELKDLVASLAQDNKALHEAQQETDKQIKELGKQIGGLGNKFGSFTEGMAFPSMKKLLREHFKMETVTTNFQVRRNDQKLELDVFAYTNGEQNEGVIVEVKSHLKEEHIEQLLEQLKKIKILLPEHASKKLYGILASVNISDEIKQKVLKTGLYLAAIHDEHFTLQIPQTFRATVF